MDASAEVLAARERLKAKFGGVRTGGRGTVRRKRRAANKSANSDDKKLQVSLKRLGVSAIPAIEEVNLFMEDESVVHFKNPKVQASIAANTYVISGPHEKKALADLLPGIISQLDAEHLQSLSAMAENFTKAQAEAAAAEGAEEAAAEGDDDDVPDLVEDFEQVSETAA
mmetsp:Transcript_15253/g.17272  ORF Transcript_15253/g.17272 Transcript_15253/m.17272 type:complete len:169 (-) Transcript_15253:233-739(-)|eukprot:CAMPEP_0184021032 /NCGR_PEP_ID=MMETSP0954-20121128/9687_1 /TAXON_ID=627963 /ORGANISM="Aplanochytrium sp, Strain PBS07" /LENGTH=168 /DNA_ID=CAMNT_0026302975 /DNA_START=262 /DNA_END=768 /DNA_ORIENTATION=-